MRNVWVFAACVVTVVVQVVAQEDQCLSGLACQPWNPLSHCVTGGRHDVRFIVDEWPGNSSTGTGKAMYNFCPLVDQTQAFLLNNSGQFAQASFTQDDNSDFNQTFISLYGMANVDHGLIVPVHGAFSRAMFAYKFDVSNNNFGTGCGGDMTAVVSFLMVNYTMSTGNYVYLKSNSSFLTGPPVNSGFLATCDENDQCLFGDPACIGEYPGRRNCARCYSATDNIGAHTTKVWASYYGSDEYGRTFTSSQDNPLNFLQYASESAYTVIAQNL